MITIIDNYYIEEAMMRSRLEYMYFKNKYPLEDTLILTRNYITSCIKKKTQLKQQDNLSKNLETFIRNLENNEHGYVMIYDLTGRVKLSIIKVDLSSYNELLKSYKFDGFGISKNIPVFKKI